MARVLKACFLVCKTIEKGCHLEEMGPIGRKLGYWVGTWDCRFSSSTVFASHVPWHEELPLLRAPATCLCPPWHKPKRIEPTNAGLDPQKFLFYGHRHFVTAMRNQHFCGTFSSCHIPPHGERARWTSKIPENDFPVGGAAYDLIINFRKMKNSVSRWEDPGSTPSTQMAAHGCL